MSSEPKRVVRQPVNGDKGGILCFTSSTGYRVRLSLFIDDGHAGGTLDTKGARELAAQLLAAAMESEKERGTA